MIFFFVDIFIEFQEEDDYFFLFSLFFNDSDFYMILVNYRLVLADVMIGYIVIEDYGIYGDVSILSSSRIEDLEDDFKRKNKVLV